MSFLRAILRAHDAVSALVVCMAATATAVLSCSSEEPAGSSSFSRPNPRPPVGDDDDEPGTSSSGGLPPARDAETLQLAQIVAGTHHTCVRWSDGVVKCWGSNYTGQLGLGDTNPRGDDPEGMGRALPMVDMGTGARASEIGAGGASTCALLVDGKVKCWGRNAFGGLGQPDEEPRGDSPESMGDALLPIDLGTNRIAKTLGVGDFSACALLNDSAVKCWGSNFGGELGYGDDRQRGGDPTDPDVLPMGDALPPIDIGLSNIQTISMTAAVAYQSGCAIAANGSMKCWGGNNYGQLGIGDTENRGDDPAEMGGQLPRVPLGENALLSIPGHDAMCVVLDTGQLRCWGRNEYGQLGQGDVALRGHNGDNLPLVNLASGSKIIHASMYDHTCTVFQDRTVKCWGRNDAGQLGLGDTEHRGDAAGEMGTALPALDLGNDAPLEIACGERHTCARFASNKVKCWGSNDAGQLGYGDTVARGATPGTMGQALPYVDLGR